MSREDEWKSVCELGELARKGRIPQRAYNNAEREYFDRYPNNVDKGGRTWIYPVSARVWDQETRVVDHG